MRLVRLTSLVVFASVSLHGLLAHAAPRDEILIYQGPPDPDIAIHFHANPSGWKGPRPGNPVTPKPGDVFFIIHDDDSSITLGTLDGYISPPFPRGDWLRDFARMPTERDPGAKQARDRIVVPGEAQTAAAREAERKAREREAGSGPTVEGAGQAEEQLSREYALDVILKSKEIQDLSTHVNLTTRGRIKGKELGMWTGTRSDPILTAKGRTLISEIDTWYVKLITPSDIPSVQVTGIADPGRGAKRAEFSWEHKHLPQEIQPLVCTGGTGQAIFQHYDDGWRVSSVTTRPRSDCQ